MLGCRLDLEIPSLFGMPLLKVGLIFKNSWPNSIGTFHFCIRFKQYFHFSSEGNLNIVANIAVPHQDSVKAFL